MRRALLIAAILLLPLMAKAQGTVNDLETDFGEPILVAEEVLLLIHILKQKLTKCYLKK